MANLTNTQRLARWRSITLTILIVLETFTRTNAVVGILTKPVYMKVSSEMRRKNEENNTSSSMQVTWVVNDKILGALLDQPSQSKKTSASRLTDLALCQDLVNQLQQAGNKSGKLYTFRHV